MHHSISVSLTDFFCPPVRQLCMRVYVHVLVSLRHKRQEYSLMYGPSVTWPHTTEKNALMCLTPVSVKWIVSRWSAGH